MVNVALLSCAHIHTKGYLKTIAEKDNCGVVVIQDDAGAIIQACHESSRPGRWTDAPEVQPTGRLTQ